SKAVHGQTVRQNGRATKLRQRKRVDGACLKVSVKETAIRPHRRSSQGQVTENIFAVQFRNRRAAIDEATSDGNAVVMIIFQSARRSAERINEAIRNSRTAVSITGGFVYRGAA